MAVPEILASDLVRLLTVTDGCRPDMHEPDEQGLSAHVVGDHLDNAFGEYIDARLVREHAQEFVVCLRRAGSTECFNLASLIALARFADAPTPAEG